MRFTLHGRRRTLLRGLAAVVAFAAGRALAKPRTAPPPTPVGGTFVRPPGAAPLMTIATANKNYDDPAYQQALARVDVAIVGFYPGWRGDTDGSLIRQAVAGIKALNPALRIGQYTILNEAVDDPAKTASDDLIAKLDATNWWLRDAAGSKLQWTAGYAAYDINSTAWTSVDENGERYPQWYARRCFGLFFEPVPEFDVWYLDGVMKYSRIAQADWRCDGADVNSQDPEVQSAFRQAQAAHWSAAAALAPARLQLGNVDNDLSYPEYSGRLGAAFLEAMMGKSWSLESRGWTGMMQRYFAVASNLAPPGLVGFNVWGAVDDWRFFRYAFTSCRLGNAHFSYTDSAAGYVSVPWFDEYEVAFGTPLDAPTLNAWSNGVYRRRFQKAMVLVNPNADARTVQIQAGWRRLLAYQDPATNSGAAVKALTLQPKDGIVLVPQ